MNPSDNLIYMLHKLGAMMEHQSDVVLFDSFGVGYSQFKILLALDYHPHVQQKEIAMFLGQTEASISRQIGLLRASELVNIDRAEDDKKKNIVSLTSRGKKLSAQALARLNEFYEPVLSSVPKQEQAVILSGMCSLQDKLEEMCAHSKINMKETI